ncbi:MAG: outer membrane lipoprotein carrier protein LolA [Kangiellaceae bacterium]|nr:outer membrane lipoprotein carrier protein LolA [Kangiellaceae bacterium]
MKYYFLLLLFVSNIILAQEEQTHCNIEQLSESISVQQSLNTFTQEKTIKVLSKPLRSTGQLLLIKEKGVIWQTLTPIKGTTVITPLQFIQLDQNDNPSSFNSAMNGQTSLTMSTIFLGLLSGDIERLQQYFLIDSYCYQDDWLLTFTTTDEQVDKFLQKIVLTGSTNKIKKIELFEANQDYSKITLQPNEDNLAIEQLVPYFENQL